MCNMNLLLLPHIRLAERDDLRGFSDKHSIIKQTLKTLRNINPVILLNPVLETHLHFSKRNRAKCELCLGL